MDGDKSDLLICLEGLAYNPNGTPQVDAKILDRAVVVNMLPTNAVSIFQEYIDDIFIPYCERTTTFSRNDRSCLGCMSR